MSFDFAFRLKKVLRVVGLLKFRAPKAGKKRFV